MTTPRRRASDRELRVFARRRLDDADVTVVDAIPVTTVARTLVDLAGIVSRERLASALSAAERASALDLEAVLAARERARGRRGAGDANLRAVLAEHAARGAQLTREALERRLRRLVRIHRLGQPLLNARVAGYEVDAYWPEARLIVETDGWQWHRDRAAFGRDRDKTNALQLAGFTVLRFTHDAVVRRPEQVAAAIRTALA
ncbi:very-short-patch-repair endonuclease [Conexibacter arvalis]|uniref:Very-short-patch-repair endonuclease n=1 Tax=Conexibacter arvalis TaxID=912552 RepID=A0A840IFP5_9ACTN|nr:very-short-patch-repair endonuclease [Conexibacter arvalis]